MVIAFAIMTFKLIPPSFERIAAPRTGPNTFCIQVRRSTTSLEYAPKRSTLPIPSFMIQYARVPSRRFSTTITGIFAEVMPPIGPTACTWWHGMNFTPPDSKRAFASSSVSHQCSNRIAPIQEPCIGPVMSLYSIGGPA